MKLNWKPFTLNLKTTFRIAHGASDKRENVIVYLDEGIGEAAVVPYYGYSQDDIFKYLARLEPGNWDPYLINSILKSLPNGPQAARAAVDIALHDVWGKRIGVPLYQLLGLDPIGIPQTSLTIGMDDPEIMANRAREENWPIYKIKLGSSDDESIVSAIRKASPAQLRVDANSGWSREKAMALIPRLSEYGVEMVEQPLPVGDIEGLRRLREQKLGTMIFADESIITARDIAAHAGAVDGVVIKIMKSGGIGEALRSIHVARSLDMQVMIICMVESTIGVTAAAHLAPIGDYVDLYGPLLIQNEAFGDKSYLNYKLLLKKQRL